ncbi:MAG: hypothetical protein ABI767_04270 [Rhodanobacter sp.]
MRFKLTKWLAAFVLIALIVLDGHAAERLSTDNHTSHCAKIGVAKVVSVAQAAQAIVCTVTDRSLLVVGEIHGSNETPDLVASLVEDALLNRPV